MYSGAYLSYAAFIDLGNNAEYTRGDLMKLFIATLALAIAANAADTATAPNTTGKGRFNANNVDLNRNFDCSWQATSSWRGQNRGRRYGPVF